MNDRCIYLRRPWFSYRDALSVYAKSVCWRSAIDIELQRCGVSEKKKKTPIPHHYVACALSPAALCRAGILGWYMQALLPAPPPPLYSTYYLPAVLFRAEQRTRLLRCRSQKDGQTSTSRRHRNNIATYASHQVSPRSIQYACLNEARVSIWLSAQTTRKRGQHRKHRKYFHVAL